jgi:hypothetical protein
MQLTALRNAEKSLSHWGVFTLPCEVVRIGFVDLGRNPIDGSFTSKFIADGRSITSGVSRHVVEQEGAEGRKRMDDAALAMAFDIDPDTLRILP